MSTVAKKALLASRYVNQRGTGQGHTFACWMLSAGANPAFIATQIGHKNAQRVYCVYSAWIHALDGDRIALLNQRVDEYNPALIAPLKVKSV